MVVDVDDQSRIDDIKRHDMIGELECALADLVTAGQQYERTLRLSGELVMHDICHMAYASSALVPNCVLCFKFPPCTEC